MLKLIKLSQILHDLDLEEDAKQVQELVNDEVDWEKELGQTEDLSTEEDKFFGDWIDEIPKLHKDTILNGLNTEGLSKFKYLGSGGFRTVFAISGTNFVVKLAKFNNSAATKANQREHNNQSAFQGLFPKVYLHGKGAFGTDYDWIIVDRVRVIKDLDVFDSFFPVLKERFPKVRVSDFFWVVSSDTGYITKKRFEKEAGATIKEILEVALTDPLFYRIMQASEQIGFEVQDIRTGNAGIDSSGNFVIIDTLYLDIL